MAKVFGAAGEHAGRQSVAAFRRMFATVFIVGIVVAFAEGVLITTVITTHTRIGWAFLPVIVGGFLYWLLRYAERRVDTHETERLTWRHGALGEYEVGAELERLSEDYSIFNNLNTAGLGNFDHIVIGPTGLFAIETKNWRGLITSNENGELKKNGKDSSQPHIGNFQRRTMFLRDQIVALTQREDFYIQPVMVFPKAHVESRFGTTRKVHCLRLEKLRDYIDNSKFSQRFGRDKIDSFVRALHGVAGMDVEFSSVATTTDVNQEGS
jgi:hypothetical protein